MPDASWWAVVTVGKIRTYNHPQGRVTDHRIKLTLYNLTEIMAGELGRLCSP